MKMVQKHHKLISEWGNVRDQPQSGFLAERQNLVDVTRCHRSFKIQKHRYAHRPLTKGHFPPNRSGFPDAAAFPSLRSRLSDLAKSLTYTPVASDYNIHGCIEYARLEIKSYEDESCDDERWENEQMKQ
jgi:hypothetical protein